MAATAVISSDDLRDQTAEILRRVDAGEEFEVMHDGRRVAKLVPIHARRKWIPAAEILPSIAALGPDQTGSAQELRDVLNG
jgi:prevent-host-death family protein